MHRLSGSGSSSGNGPPMGLSGMASLGVGMGGIGAMGSLSALGASLMGSAPAPVPERERGGSEMPPPNTNMEPYSVFLVDDTLSDLQKVRRYVQSQLPLQRLVYVKRITSVARSVGVEETISQILPLLSKIINDTEVVIRQAIALELSDLSQYLANPDAPAEHPLQQQDIHHGYDTDDEIQTAINEAQWKETSHATSTSTSSSSTSSSASSSASSSSSSSSASSSTSTSTSTSSSSTSTSTSSSTDSKSSTAPDIRARAYTQIKSSIIPCIQTLIVDSSAEVRQSASDALVAIANVLHGDDVGRVVLTMVLNLAHDDRDEQRTTAVHLLHELAPRLGHDLCVNFVALELAAFADDATFRVRKATAQSFGNVCKTIGEKLTVTKLLPHYIKLSKDLIWGVRKGCVDSMVAVCKVVSPETRQEVFIPMFERFAKDTSRWVRNGAFEILGPFLHTLGSDLVTPEILAYFTGIPTMTNAVVDAEVNYFCAYNFPAVALTLGPERWEELVPCFDALSRDTKFPVRRTLACSIHVLAAIIGQSHTEQYLLRVVDTFLKDLDEVKHGIIKHLSTILKYTSQEKRELYLDQFFHFQRQNENWRWRQHVARQMNTLATLYSAEITGTKIQQLVFGLCRDKVAAVRNAAVEAMGTLVSRLYTDNPAAYLTVQDQILQFSTSKTYMERQLFVRMCTSLITSLPHHIFETDYLPALAHLAIDPTTNVKITVAHALNTFKNHPHFSTSKHILAMQRKLASDPDRDVKAIVTSYDTPHIQTEAEIDAELDDILGVNETKQKEAQHENKEDEKKHKKSHKKSKDKNKSRSSSGAASPTHSATSTSTSSSSPLKTSTSSTPSNVSPSPPGGIAAPPVTLSPQPLSVTSSVHPTPLTISPSSPPLSFPRAGTISPLAAARATATVVAASPDHATRVLEHVTPDLPTPEQERILDAIDRVEDVEPVMIPKKQMTPDATSPMDVLHDREQQAEQELEAMDESEIVRNEEIDEKAVKSPNNKSGRKNKRKGKR